jgi:hypothetical protein
MRSENYPYRSNEEALLEKQFGAERYYRSVDGKIDVFRVEPHQAL